MCSLPPPLSGETEPPAPEDLEELRREEMASRRVRGGRGWSRRVKEMEEGDRVRERVDSERVQQKEAEKLGVEGDAIAIQ